MIATVGRQLDPATWGAVPPAVHLERYVPQAMVLPHVDAVVSHGGSGSVVGALSFGLPSVLLPMGADQTHNAERCRRLGVGIVLDPLTATPRAIGEAVGVGAGRRRRCRSGPGASPLEAAALPDAAGPPSPCSRPSSRDPAGPGGSPVGNLTGCNWPWC